MNKLFPLFLLPLLAACATPTDEADATGVFEATETLVAARQGGEILHFTPVEGQTLAAGQQVGQLDSTQLVLQRQQLRASLSASDARQLDASAQLAALRQQEAHLRSEQQRYSALVREQAAAQKQVDDLTQQLAVVQRQIAAQAQQLTANNSSQSAQSEAIAAQIAQLDDRIRQCRIVAPTAGTVVSRLAEPGEMCAPGRPLFKLAQLDVLTLRAYVEAPQLAQLRLGQKVEVMADFGEGQQRYRGTVSWISDQAEFTPKTIQTRDERSNLVYAVKIRVPNDGRLKRGMYGEVRW